MSIVLDGTRGVSASGGLYAANTFTGTYTDGIVVDYINGNGRISVGAADGLTFYNNGVANNALVTLDVYGRLTVNGGDNNGLWPSTAPGLYFQRTQASSESNIPFIRAESDATTTNLLIGSSSSGGIVKFITGSSLLERMRLDANGNLLVGTTTNTENSRLNVSQPTNGYWGGVFKTPGSATDGGVWIKCGDGSSGAWIIEGTTSSGTTKFRVLGNGNVQNTNNSYGALSDQRLKENIVDASEKLEDLCQVRVRNFNMVGDDQKQIGVIAQEIEQVFPNLVEEDRDGYKSVKYSVFVPILIKSIQELTARLEASEAKNTELENRIAALENK